MERKAQVLELHKNLKYEERRSNLEKEERRQNSEAVRHSRPNFIRYYNYLNFRSIEDDTYGGKMEMADRVKRNQANIQRRDYHN